MEDIQRAKTERADIERLFDRAEDLRDYPGSYFPAKIRAEKAQADWRKRYPEFAASQDAKARAEAEARQAQKDEEFRSSFIGRGLD